MRRKNPLPSGVPPVDELPPEPAENQRSSLVMAGLLAPLAVVFDGNRWISLDSGILLADAGAVGLRQSAVVINGVAVLCDIAQHNHVDGVVAGLGDGYAAIRRDGLVSGFAGLTAPRLLAVGAVPGSVVEAPFSAAWPAILGLGFVYDANTIQVRLGERKGM